MTKRKLSFLTAALILAAMGSGATAGEAPAERITEDAVIMADKAKADTDRVYCYSGLKPNQGETGLYRGWVCVTEDRGPLSH